jgi:hypothetical protein
MIVMGGQKQKPKQVRRALLLFILFLFFLSYMSVIKVVILVFFFIYFFNCNVTFKIIIEFKIIIIIFKKIIINF